MFAAALFIRALNGRDPDVHQITGPTKQIMVHAYNETP